MTSSARRARGLPSLILFVGLAVVVPSAPAQAALPAAARPSPTVSPAPSSTPDTAAGKTAPTTPTTKTPKTPKTAQPTQPAPFIGPTAPAAPGPAGPASQPGPPVQDRKQAGKTGGKTAGTSGSRPVRPTGGTTSRGTGPAPAPAAPAPVAAEPVRADAGPPVLGPPSTARSPLSPGGSGLGRRTFSAAPPAVLALPRQQGTAAARSANTPASRAVDRTQELVRDEVVPAVQTLVRASTKNPAFPLSVALVVAVFLLVQHRIDARDPKLADAPLEGPADLAFAPPVRIA